MTNLWGKLPEVKKLVTPSRILAEQATALQEMSGGMLVGEVVRISNVDQEKIVSEFRAIAPALNNYRIRILRMSHGIISYPCDIITLFDARPAQYRASNEAEFTQMVGNVLSDENLLALLSNTIAQSIAMAE